MLLSTASQAGANLLINGDFETGDFTGWTQFGDTSFSGVDTSDPEAGSFAAFFGPLDTGGISQTIQTIPGAVYIVTFWLQSEEDVNGESTPNFFEFDWGGVPELTLSDAPANPYTLYTFALVATSTSTTLTFAFENLPAFWDFDTASAVPEPGSLALVALGGALVAFVRRRRGA
ncbi:MAG TPA: PEP-CTERM sorting domain-containing protein [Candidatus Kryptonia bacterium]|nr:PEP-CTERM sorting domain-containing protein [Candidatus Kryptonia bacterium]